MPFPCGNSDPGFHSTGLLSATLLVLSLVFIAQLGQHFQSLVDLIQIVLDGRISATLRGAFLTVAINILRLLQLKSIDVYLLVHLTV